MNSTPHGHNTHDAFAADEPLGDLLGDWAEELRSAVVSDLPTQQIETIAGIASAAVVSAGAAATAAGTSAVGLTGGTKMSSLLASTVAKFAVSAAAVATLGTGAAVAGVLPDTVQSRVADVAEVVAIDLPRPDLTIDVDGAGEVVVEVVDGILGVVEIDGAADWEAEIVSQTDTSAAIEFVSDSASKTLTVATDTSGEVISRIDSARTTVETAEPAGQAGTDASVEADAEASAVPSSPSTDTGVSGSSSSSTSGGAEADGSEAGVDADVQLDLDAGISVGQGDAEAG